MRIETKITDLVVAPTSDVVDIGFTVTRPMKSPRGYQATSGLRRLKKDYLVQFLLNEIEEGNIITIVSIRQV
jgi:hypothetical protein